jgi:NADPH-dependent 2,4-dienoyl-CoA reductase/sulfur reductase-like enzyme/rhodanese-related sulfurtransferase
MTALNIIVIGGVAGGMSAATRARRMNETARIMVIERGGFISFANCGMPYYVAGRIAREDKLLITTPEKVWARYRIEVRLHTEAMRIDRVRKIVDVKDLATGRMEEVAYDKLILAPGASAIVPPIEGIDAENVFTVRSMEDTRRLQMYLAAVEPKKAIVVGGGFIGLEMAEALHDRGLSVEIVEKSPHVLPMMDGEMAMDMESELRAKGVRVVTGVGLKGLKTDGDGRVTAVELDDGRALSADLVILSIGVQANTALALNAGLALGASGGIAVDVVGRTSDPDIYAVGDAAEVAHGVTGMSMRVPLAGPANRRGRLAGEHAATGKATGLSEDHGARQGVMGTAIVQVVGLTAGITGLSETAAIRAGFAVETAYVTANDHAGYYPGAVPVRVKLVYEKGSGRVLGAQAVGRAGIDKRLDVVATVMHFGGTIDDLAELDLAYAPQFGSAKDVLHMAAFAAQNQRDGATPTIMPAQINGRQLVDVRTREEFAKGHLPNAVLMPVDELRGRVGELNASRPTAVTCQSGLRGHVAVRMLKQLGFKDVVNVKGGWALAERMQRI